MLDTSNCSRSSGTLHHDSNAAENEHSSTFRRTTTTTIGNSFVPMASPIWEEDAAPSTSPYQQEVDDDVPLSFYNSFSPSSSSGGGSGRNTAGVRRSHTVTAAGSRLHRISSGNSGTSTSSTSAASVSTLPTSSESSSRPLSASTGVSRKTSMNKTSPGLNRVMEGSTSEEEQQQQQQPQPIQYPSNAYLPDANEDNDDDDDIDNQALYGYGNAPSSLARHSSMPVSRAFRRDPTNPGAPWQRVSSIHRHSNNTPQYNQQQHASYNGVNGVEHTDSTAAETRLSGLIGSPTTSLFNHPTSPNAPTSPLNSGFVVTSRPSSVSISGSGFPSSSMSAAPGHGRSLSSHGWSSSTKSDAKNASANNHSPTHSRHASDSVSSHSASANLHTHQQPQLGRVPSNASSTTHTSSNHASTPSPASPIDSSLLGQNNPWSPTAQERLHFRELSGTLNLATLRGSPASGGLVEHGDLASSSSGTATSVSGGGVNGPISPPSSRRGSLFKDPSSPRRANSLNLHGRNMRNRIEEPVPALPSALGAATSARQPLRRNTPILPPLVTSSEALYSGAIEGAGTQQGTVQQVTDNGAGQQTNVASPPLQQSHPNGNTSGAKIIRGPASAAPYVPPIGHTHASDRKSTSPEHVMHPPRQGHQPAPHVARNNGQHAGLDHLAHLRGFTTAGPGLPESSYLQEKDRVAGTNGFMDTQQQQQQQHGQGVPGFTSTPISANTAGSLNSAITMQFPSLNNVNPASAAAFTNNLQLQQHLLAQQTQALHEQQNQLAVALASGLHLQDRQGVNGTVNGNVPDGLQASLPTSPLQGGQVQMQMQGNNDPYTISAKIEALQKANAMLAAAMHDPNAQNHAQSQQNQLLQQGQTQYIHPLPPQVQRHASPAPGMFGSFAHGMQHHSPGPSVDLGRPGTGSGLILQHVHQSQQRHDGVSPIDIIALSAAKGYNPPVFDTRPAQARFFVIKSFTEDDVFKSIKFEIWSSTVLGNNRLDKAFADQTDKGPIYLFFSVNASGHFCGVAEMLTALDYTVTSNVWAQGDKWKGVMKLRWIYIKDIPNPALRHLKLTNTNEQKPVTSSRDTQEVPYEQGCEMLRIFVSYQSKTSLLQDFAYYQAQTATDPAQPPPSTAGPKMNNPHNGAQGSTQPPPAAFTQPGHPNPYNHTQHRSSTPHQQQQFSGQLNQAQYQYPHQQYPQQQYPQQQQPRNRQAVQAKR